MTDSNAFSFGAQERSWWANSMDPEVQAERARAAEEQRLAVAHQEAVTRQNELMLTAGGQLIDIIEGYASGNVPADTQKVARDFSGKGFPDGEFRNVLEQLKALGLVYEAVSGAPGFMGERVTRLHLLEK
ncbi:hypothetical protein [Streptomyces sp. NPDC091217]|uniref:hypothetical protein n=1 Tax=Streptomyces sp. NPDC091217 TaxID=3365975 RepID=UPI00380FC09B